MPNQYSKKNVLLFVFLQQYSSLRHWLQQNPFNASNLQYFQKWYYKSRHNQFQSIFTNNSYTIFQEWRIIAINAKRFFKKHKMLEVHNRSTRNQMEGKLICHQHFFFKFRTVHFPFTVCCLEIYCLAKSCLNCHTLRNIHMFLFLLTKFHYMKYAQMHGHHK